MTRARWSEEFNNVARPPTWGELWLRLVLRLRAERRTWRVALWRVRRRLRARKPGNHFRVLLRPIAPLPRLVGGAVGGGLAGFAGGPSGRGARLPGAPVGIGALTAALRAQAGGATGNPYGPLSALGAYALRQQQQQQHGARGFAIFEHDQRQV